MTRHERLAALYTSLSPADLTVLQQELKGRPNEDRDILFVCLGMELRTDPKHGGFFQHQPAQAKVSVTRKTDTITVAITDLVSPSVVERLKQQAGVLQPRIDDWRAMVDTVMIDPAYTARCSTWC